MIDRRLETEIRAHPKLRCAFVQLLEDIDFDSLQPGAFDWDAWRAKALAGPDPSPAADEFALEVLGEPAAITPPADATTGALRLIVSPPAHKPELEQPAPLPSESLSAPAAARSIAPDISPPVAKAMPAYVATAAQDVDKAVMLRRIALGRNGKTYYVAARAGEVLTLSTREFDERCIRMIFDSDTELLERLWPEFSVNEKNERSVIGWNVKAAANDLQRACDLAGHFDPQHQLRHRGAHRGPAGELIQNAGDEILIGDKSYAPGRLGEHYYVRGRPGLKPAVGNSQAGPRGIGAALLTAFRYWNWRRPSLDPVLLLGLAACGMTGGAQDFRPLTYITGGSGVGKSGVIGALRDLNGGASCCVWTTDPTEAGIRRELGGQTIAVFIDENEAADGRDSAQREETMLKLFRNAVTGGSSLRADPRGGGESVTIRSSISCASIRIPSLREADENRMLILELEHPRTTTASPLKPEQWTKLGQQLLRRCVDRWPDFAPMLEAMRGELLRLGYRARGADALGTALAWAELVLTDAKPTARLAAQWVAELRVREHCPPHDLRGAEGRALLHILTVLLPREGTGARHACAWWIAQAAMRDDPALDVETQKKRTAARDRARLLLRDYGLAIDGTPATHLVVANEHAGLNSVLAGTPWHGRADGRSIVAQDLLRLPDAEPIAQPRYFGAGHKNSRGVRLPLAPYVDLATVLDDPAEPGG